VPRRHGRRTPSPYVSLDRSLCSACFECVAVCPKGVIGKIDVPLHRHAVMQAGDLCAGCGRCVEVCTAGALSIVYRATKLSAPERPATPAAPRRPYRSG
jgi:ferredoxin